MSKNGFRGIFLLFDIRLISSIFTLFGEIALGWTTTPTRKYRPLSRLIKVDLSAWRWALFRALAGIWVFITWKSRY